MKDEPVKKTGEIREPNKECRMLPIITYNRKKWFFDERLKQLRNVKNPHDFTDLNDFEVEYFRKKGSRGNLK